MLKSCSNLGCLGINAVVTVHLNKMKEQFMQRFRKYSL